MVTRDPGGDRPAWAPTRPLQLTLAARPTDFADSRPAEPWPLARPAVRQAVRPAVRQAVRPAVRQAVRPAVRQAVAEPLQAPRAPEFWPALRPAPIPKAAAAAQPGDFGRSTAPAAPTRHRPLAAPAHTTPSAPSASTHWQLAGKPGEHLVLMPGQMHLGQQAASVRTLLGSCVAITLWHPLRRIGGMCHFLLPQRQRRPGDAPDGRYGDEALEAMVKTLQTLRAEPGECVAHLYGGADTLSGCGALSFNIGERNIEQGWRLIDRYGFTLDGVDVGEDIPRVVSLALNSGAVSMRRGRGKAPDHLRGSPS